MDRDLVARYRALKGYTMRVGHYAADAWALAKAEQRAEREGFQAVWEPEEESYRDVYGEDPPAGVSFYWVAVYAPDAEKRPSGRYRDVPLASLGMVDDTDPKYGRSVVASLYSEALDAWDAARDAEACAMAEELAGRATFAAGGAS